MPNGITKPSALPRTWSALEVMSRDDGVLGAGDGVLTIGELQSHIDRLVLQRNQLVSSNAPTTLVDVRMGDAQKLYADMVTTHSAGVQYLPDALMGLPVSLRRRASELLVNDDIAAVGEIDAYVLAHARSRYKMMMSAGSSATMMSAQKALAELDQLAAALGIQMP